MPALAAHYQFGQLVLEKVSEDIKVIIKENKEMFDLGLQGPDLLFFFKPQGKNKISKTGHEIHSKKGSEFFLELIKNKENLTKGQKAYLIGALCHYSLDRNCHPLINKYTKTSINHQILESEFDKIIIDKYKLSNKRYKIIPIKNIDTEGLSNIYNGVTKSEIKESLYTMRVANKFLEYRKLVERVENLLSKPKAFSTLSLPKEIKSDSKAYNIIPLFEKSLPDAINLIELISDNNIEENKIKENMLLNFEGVLT